MQQESNKPKSGKVVGIIIFVIFALVALVTVSHFVNIGNSKNDKNKDHSMVEKGENQKIRENTQYQKIDNEWEVTITGNIPEDNNISIPPGSVYQIKTSIPINILFEDANGNTEVRELRPDEEKQFPAATPIKAWRQKPGKSIIRYSYTQKN